jgi:hypothetical protein
VPAGAELNQQKPNLKTPKQPAFDDKWQQSYHALRKSQIFTFSHKFMQRN